MAELAEGWRWQLNRQRKISVTCAAGVGGGEQDVVNYDFRRACGNAVTKRHSHRQIVCVKTRRTSAGRDGVVEMSPGDDGSRRHAAVNDRRSRRGLDDDGFILRGHVQVVEDAKIKSIVAGQHQIADGGVGQALVIELRVGAGGNGRDGPPVA